MKILALDTSSQNACIAILEDENILIELNNEDEKTHSQKLMPMIDTAFQKSNLNLDDIDLIACGLGPGSFTGVRIGISTSKAFADCKNIPCTGVTSLESLAFGLNQEGYICSLIDAKHNNVYAGLFHIAKTNNVLQIIESDLTFLNLDNENNSLINFLENNSKVFISNCPIYFVGDGVIVYKNLLQNLSLKKDNKIVLADEKKAVISSINIAKLGYTKYKNKNFGNSSVLSPIYLRKSQAELALEEKHLN